MLDCSTGTAVAVASHNRPKAVGCKGQAFAQKLKDRVGFEENGRAVMTEKEIHPQHLKPIMISRDRATESDDERKSPALTKDLQQHLCHVSGKQQKVSLQISQRLRPSSTS